MSARDGEGDRQVTEGDRHPRDDRSWEEHRKSQLQQQAVHLGRVCVRGGGGGGCSNEGQSLRAPLPAATATRHHATRCPAWRHTNQACAFCLLLAVRMPQLRSNAVPVTSGTVHATATKQCCACHYRYCVRHHEAYSHVTCACFAGLQPDDDQVDKVIDSGEADNIFRKAVQIDQVSVCLPR